LGRASVGVVDEATTAERKQGLVSRSNTVVGLLALLTALLSRACNDGLVLGLAGDVCNRVEYVVGLTSGIGLDGRCDLGSDKLVRVDIVTLGHSCPGGGVGGLSTTKLGLNHSGNCRADRGSHCSLSKGAGLCCSGDSGVNSLLNENALQAVNSVGKLLEVLEVSSFQVGGTAHAARNT
jgi:hypothetical protein